MTKKYQKNNIDTPTDGLVVPERVSVAMAEIAGSMREGLLALAVGTGLQVMQTLMEADLTALAGPKGRHDPQRAAVRHGHERGSVTLGGRRVPVTRPRVRAADGTGELPVASYELFGGTEILGAMAMERMLAGLSTRRYPVGLEPVGEQITATARSTSKSAVSRKFVAMTETALAELLAADLSALDLVALMVDGVHFGESVCVVALGIDAEGVKRPLALVEGATENATVVTALLVGLRERGLDVTRPLLVGIDGAKALRTAVVDVFDHPVIQRCQLHKIRNVQDRLPQRPLPHRSQSSTAEEASDVVAVASSTVVWGTSFGPVGPSLRRRCGVRDRDRHRWDLHRRLCGRRVREGGRNEDAVDPAGLFPGFSDRP